MYLLSKDRSFTASPKSPTFLIRDDFMDRFLKKYGKNYEIIERMIEEKKIVKVLFNDHYFFLRNFKERVSLLH